MSNFYSFPSESTLNWFELQDPRLDPVFILPRKVLSTTQKIKYNEKLPSILEHINNISLLCTNFLSLSLSIPSRGLLNLFVTDLASSTPIVGTYLFMLPLRKEELYRVNERINRVKPTFLLATPVLGVLFPSVLESLFFFYKTHFIRTSV